MSRHYPESDSDSGDEFVEAKSGASQTKDAQQPVGRSINEMLVRALELAASPGFGDEEPEVLEAPPHTSSSKVEDMRCVSQDPAAIKRSGCTDDLPDAKVRKNQQEGEQKYKQAKNVDDTAYERIEERNQQMLAEEERVANLVISSADVQERQLSQQLMKERAKYIPLRLTYEERKSLRLVNAAIGVSDYTTAVDIMFRNKARRPHAQLQHIVAFLSGLISATNYERGQQVLDDRNFAPFGPLIQNMLEVARRYKITNPEKMRSEYGKLVFLMQDAVSETILPLLSVDIHKPILTVHDVLEKAGGLALLEDPLISIATAEVLPDKNKSRAMIQNEIKRKERASENIVRKYTKATLSADTIRACMYSISDNNSFLNSNRKPVSDCIELLQQYFSPNVVDVDGGYSLAIDEGVSGARLTHSHELQYNYVLQSLTLWAAILQDMFRLWYLAEEDLLNAAQPYELCNTGQGLQRVQQSPRVFKAMHEILAYTKANLGLSWVGSEVIHLGDHNVPNALMFIDKYTQVARILGPLITTLKNLETACEEDAGLGRYLQAYGGIEKARKDILHDFFTHAFDGSGGDNFFDAGSCIDGRLTSAWNWCSQLASKPYYPLFRLTGFLSFDGQFEK